MKIQYCSDLHLEFPENKKFIQDNPIVPKGEILVLAGDIIPFAEMDKHDYFFDYVSENFEFVYWIAGNHEYYFSDLELRNGEFREEIRKNVFLVNNTWAHHGNTRLIFSTLWSKISPEKAWTIENGLNDFRLIKYGKNKFSTLLYNKLFEENFEFIQKAVSKNEREKCVVVTHHVPTFNNYPPQYVGSNINEAFAVDLDSFIENSKIDFWIYGHHHSNTPDFKIGNTIMLTNQLGNVKYNEHSLFKTEKVFET